MHLMKNKMIYLLNYGRKVKKLAQNPENKEIVVKDEPYDYDEFDQFSNERQQKIALNKTVKEENVEKRVKSEFKEEFDNGNDGEKSTDSKKIDEKIAQKLELSRTTIYNCKKQFGVLKKRKNYTDAEKNLILEKKIAQKLELSRTTIYNWKKQFGVSKKQKNYTDTEKNNLDALGKEIQSVLEPDGKRRLE
uniref:Transposase n=1 Tax=Globodera rostochiensis TaxID=31243 RepID=A0A914IDW7_GLORO